MHSSRYSCCWSLQGLFICSESYSFMFLTVLELKALSAVLIIQEESFHSILNNWVIHPSGANNPVSHLNHLPGFYWFMLSCSSAAPSLKNLQFCNVRFLSFRWALSRGLAPDVISLVNRIRNHRVWTILAGDGEWLSSLNQEQNRSWKVKRHRDCRHRRTVSCCQKILQRRWLSFSCARIKRANMLSDTVILRKVKGMESCTFYLERTMSFPAGDPSKMISDCCVSVHLGQQAGGDFH